jgi:Uma2 family endonuclease
MQTTFKRPAAATPHRFDVDDYYRMAKAGILSPKDRVELIEGEIVDMALIGSAYGADQSPDQPRGTAGRRGPGDRERPGPAPSRSPQRVATRPMLLRPRPDFYESSHPTAADVPLLIEVAGTSLAYGRGHKLVLYARHGMPEVWIVDLVRRAVELCRQPSA